MIRRNRTARERMARVMIARERKANLRIARKLLKLAKKIMAMDVLDELRETLFERIENAVKEAGMTACHNMANNIAKNQNDIAEGSAIIYIPDKNTNGDQDGEKMAITVSMSYLDDEGTLMADVEFDGESASNREHDCHYEQKINMSKLRSLSNESKIKQELVKKVGFTLWGDQQNLKSLSRAIQVAYGDPYAEMGVLIEDPEDDEFMDSLDEMRENHLSYGRNDI